MTKRSCVCITLKTHLCALGSHTYALETSMCADSCGHHLACTALHLDVHEQPTHKEAEGATTIVDAILYLVGGMEGDDIGVVIQEDTPARTMPCE